MNLCGSVTVVWRRSRSVSPDEFQARYSPDRNGCQVDEATASKHFMVIDASRMPRRFSHSPEAGSLALTVVLREGCEVE